MLLKACDTVTKAFESCRMAPGVLIGGPVALEGVTFSSKDLLLQRDCLLLGVSNFGAGFGVGGGRGRCWRSVGRSLQDD